MTSTLPALWISAPTTGFSVPVMASTMTMKLSVSENVILSLMVRIMRLESAMRCGSALTSSSTSAISAASTAMSLPHAGDGQLFEKTAELHDERDLTRGEVFADADRRDQRDAGDYEQCDIFFCAAQL